MPRNYPEAQLLGCVDYLETHFLIKSDTFDCTRYSDDRDTEMASIH